MPTVAEFTAYLERFAPCAAAAEWDNVGLLLGDPGAPVSRVMTCLTVTPDVVEEAVREGANLIVSHHPILFRGAKKLTAATPDGQVVLPLRARASRCTRRTPRSTTAPAGSTTGCAGGSASRTQSRCARARRGGSANSSRSCPTRTCRRCPTRCSPLELA